MKKIQVFNCENIPYDSEDEDNLQDAIAAHYHSTNGFYPWYPNVKSMIGRSEEFIIRVNTWLFENGMELESTNKDFYVLFFMDY